MNAFAYQEQLFIPETFIHFINELLAKVHDKDPFPKNDCFFKYILFIIQIPGEVHGV